MVAKHKAQFTLLEETKNKDKKSPTPKGVDEMKNIYKRKDGRFEYSKMINNERIYFISKYKNVVEKKVRELKAQNKKLINIHIFKNIVLEWYNNFKKDNIGAKAQESYNNTLFNYIIPTFGNKNIVKITFKELQLYINSISKRRIQELVCQHLKAIFAYALANRYITINPTEALKLPKNTNKKSIKPLTVKEQETLLKAIKGQPLETFILFSLVLGTRRNETLAFKIEDINLQRGEIHINGTKTENAERDIKISPAMIDYLLSHNHKAPYFNYTSDYVTKHVTKTLKELGINKTLHALRHTTATNLYYLGWKDKARQQYLGHANILTTNNIYTYIENDISKVDILAIYGNLYFNIDDKFDDKNHN